MSGEPVPVVDPEMREWPRRRLWITLSVALLLMLACIAVPIGYVVVPLIVGTVNADHGEGSPAAALAAFVYTFDDGKTDIGVQRLIVPERRTAILKQRRDYIDAMTTDTKTSGWSATFETAGPQPTDRQDVHGDQAVTVDSYRVRWTPPADSQQGGAAFWYDGDSKPWRAEVRKDSTGWRLWSVTIPPWCGDDGYSTCRPRPAPTGVPSASPSPDDPLGGVRSMLPCGPADPLRQYHDCPSATPS